MNIKSVKYERPEFPICYEQPLLPDSDGLATIDLMRSSGIVWYWDATEPNSLDVRHHWIKLDEHTQKQFFEEYFEWQDDGARPGLMIVGGDLLESAEKLESEIRLFVEGRESLVQLVINQPGDMRNEYIFVNAAGENALQQASLLGAVDHVKPYGRLGVVALESLRIS